MQPTLSLSEERVEEGYNLKLILFETEGRHISLLNV